MARKLSKKDWEARAEAYCEAAMHLEMTWTEDDKEKEQSSLLMSKFWLEWERCMSKASNLEVI